MGKNIESKTERDSHGGLYGMLQSAVVGTDEIWRTTVTDKDTGEKYTGIGSTPKEAEENASDKYNRR